MLALCVFSGVAVCAICASSALAGKTREVIFSPNAPKPLAPYSHAIRADSMIYLAGQLGIDPVTNILVTGGIANEAEQALKNVGAVLQAAGANYTDVVQVTIFFKDLAHFSEVNGIYGRYFPNDPPARTGIQVADLPANALIEIETVAYLSSSAARPLVEITMFFVGVLGLFILTSLVEAALY